jgi:OFA family oxalate/formate antiporter-like MFS transporter
LFAGAYALAGFAGFSYPLVFIALGPMLGIAIAAGYVVPLSTATSWFPQIKGTVTGLAVMGFGGGAILAAFVVRSLGASGMGLSSLLTVIGLGGGVVLVIAALIQKYPDEVWWSFKTGSVKHLRIAEVVVRTDFWVLYGTMFLATLGGLLIIGSIGAIGRDFSMGNAAALGVSFLALGNSTGRLIWGSLMDKLGQKAIPLSLAVMSGGFLLLLISPGIAGGQVLFLIAVVITGFQFGASLVLYGAFTERHFGSGAISTVYPLIFTAYGLAALVGPAVGGMIYDALGSYQQIVGIMVAVPILALLLFAARFNGRRQFLVAREEPG